MPEDPKSRLRCFIATPFEAEFVPVREALLRGILAAGARRVDSAADRSIESLRSSAWWEERQGLLARADIVIADITSRDPSISFQIGLAQAMRKRIVICTSSVDTRLVPVDFQEYLLLQYEQTESGLNALSVKIADIIRKLRRLPRRAAVSPIGRSAPPFSIDWERLDPSEAENLCRELLAQMGYQRLDWVRESPEIDLIAELPKKDPDGFEYRELWLISIGRRASPTMLLEMARRDPDYIFHRLLSRGDHFTDRLMSRNSGNQPITLLLIFLGGDNGGDEFEYIRARFSTDHVRKGRNGPFGNSLRFRLWDRNYLSSLVQQFPQLGYKYFSDEGRAQSKYRKSPDELYQENVALSDRQAQLIRDLESEKNRRVSAERDAIWKDISFSAAHKIGNPIFSIETDIDPLYRRVKELRTSEAIVVIDNMRSAVDKAKAIIDQFKSLTKAQQIKPANTFLKPVLQDAVRSAMSNGILCTLVCADDFTVYADPERLSEVFDELVMNSMHWFDKEEKSITITAEKSFSIPALLDASREYALIHVKDNGAGVKIEDKVRIFDAFVTRHQHGTGLGLALVRRIIEGHSGLISEVGVFGVGADFEIFLPISPVGTLAPPSPIAVARIVKSKRGRTIK